MGFTRQMLAGTACALAMQIAGPSAQAISENGYQAQYENQVVPFFNQVGRTGLLHGQRGRMLPYVEFVHPRPRGSVVISAGFNESFRKYDEVAFDLYQQGYSVYILDHRGQGSGQHFLNDSQKGYVDLFKYFALDFKRFVNQVVPKDRAVPRLLLAHSLGGGIGAYYLEKYPRDFAGAVLSSPMLTINLGRDEQVADLELHALRALGKDQSYAPGVTPYDPAQVPFEGNVLTHSPERFAKNTNILVEHPEVFLAGQTVHWLIEAIRGSRFARSHGSYVRTPTLLLQAGADLVVLPGGQNQFCRAAQACSLVVVDQANHEILQEKDSIRGPAMTRILDFFEMRVNAVRGTTSTSRNGTGPITQNGN